MMTAIRRPTRTPGRRPRLPIRKRTAVVWGSAIAAVALVASGLTAATFVDTEHAKLGTGLGTGTFNLQVATSGSGPWTNAETPGAAITVPLTGATATNLVPGGAAAVARIHIRNNGTYAASLSQEVTATTQPSPTALLGKLNITVQPSGGAAAPYTLGSTASLPNLAAGAQTWVEVAVGLDQSAGNALQGQSVELLATVTGQSIPAGGG